jgi:TRAP-type mannitol/chloroaromatic compound transport system permease small subunit
MPVAFILFALQGVSEFIKHAYSALKGKEFPVES